MRIKQTDIGLVGGTVWAILAIQNVAGYLIYGGPHFWVIQGAKMAPLVGLAVSTFALIMPARKTFCRRLAVASCVLAALYFVFSLVPTSVDIGTLSAGHVRERSTSVAPKLKKN